MLLRVREKRSVDNRRYTVGILAVLNKGKAPEIYNIGGAEQASASDVSDFVKV